MSSDFGQVGWEIMSGNGRHFCSDFGIVRFSDVGFLDVDCTIITQIRTTVMTWYRQIIFNEIKQNLK